MGRRNNKKIRKVMLEVLGNYTGENGRITWKPVMEILERQFPNEDLTFDRVRSIYRSSTEEELARVQSTSIKKELDIPEIKDKDEGILKRKGNTLEASKITMTNPANLKIEELVEIFGLDETKWECTGYTAKSWNTTMKDRYGDPMVARNYSVKANFKLRQKEKLKEEDLSWIFKNAREASLKDIKNRLSKISKVSKTFNTLVLALFDQHLGKLAWGEETGENYDIKIASKRFLETAIKLIDRSSQVGFDRIIFPIGNDFFQFDGINSETTRGTRVDSDIRWKKLFRLGVDLLREVLDYASRLAPVDVILVQGNHDNMMSFYVFETLRGWYYDNPNVTIDNDVRTRTYRQVGVNLLGFTHGDKEKDNIYRLMQQEARELWGKTLYAEWITGHYHKNFMDEKQGVTKRVVGSLTGTDAWHYESGYVGSLKAAQALIYNEKQLGPHAILHESINIKEEPDQL